MIAMCAIVFCGPSLPDQDPGKSEGIEFLPPAKQGDVFRAACAKPSAIGIIDGYFDGMPAVWHKEILWAIHQGIAVFGAASMGALRAAEMEAFGMRGIGRIFEDYRDGRLEDDDEVALLHGPAEIGYPALSEPMVNIRATLERAGTEEILSTEEVDMIADRAKAIFYSHRSWEKILDGLSLGSARQVNFSDWLVSGRVDQKKDDAQELLTAIERFIRNGETEAPAGSHFEITETWANASWLNEPMVADESAAAILGELAKDNDRLQTMQKAALLGLLADMEADRLGLEPGKPAVVAEEDVFRQRNNLFSGKELDDWAERNDINRAEFRRLMANRARITQLISEYENELSRRVIDQLRLQGNFESLRPDESDIT